MLVPPESSSAVFVMIRITFVFISNRSHARRVNSGKITISQWGTPIRCPRSRGISSPTSGAKFGHKILQTLRYHTLQTQSLYLTWASIGTGSWQTDGQTDRIAIARQQLVGSATISHNTNTITNTQYNTMAIFLVAEDRGHCAISEQCHHRGHQLLSRKGAGTVGPGGQMTPPPPKFTWGQTWYFDPRFFLERYISGTHPHVVIKATS